MHLETTLVSEANQAKTNITWYHLQMESTKKKKDTYELIYKTERDSQT